MQMQVRIFSFAIGLLSSIEQSLVTARLKLKSYKISKRLLLNEWFLLKGYPLNELTYFKRSLVVMYL